MAAATEFPKSNLGLRLGEISRRAAQGHAALELFKSQTIFRIHMQGLVGRLSGPGRQRLGFGTTVLLVGLFKIMAPPRVAPLYRKMSRNIASSRRPSLATSVGGT